MLGQAEILSAFHRKFREGVITPKAYQARLAEFEADREAGAFHWLPAGSEVLQRITDVYVGLPRAVYPREADALHLTTALP